MSHWLQRRFPSDCPKGTVLHVAPEPMLHAYLRREFTAYVGLDLNRADVDVLASLEFLPFAGRAFDVVVCSHVLEHVLDDRAALSELLRVLGRQGICLVMVPQSGWVTVEDPTCTGPEERRRRFGQSDHVRFYGEDLIDRLVGVGFKVDVIRGKEWLTDTECAKTGITEAAGNLYVCTRGEGVQV